MKSGARTDLEPNAERRKVSVTQAAQQFKVSEQSVNRANRVLNSGDKELIKQVDAGEVAVTRAADLLSKQSPRKRKTKKANAPATVTPRQLRKLAFQLYKAVEAITGLPDIETLIKSTKATRHHDRLHWT